MREHILQVLDASLTSVQRMGEAGTSVTFVVADHPEPPVTLLLDRVPPQVSDQSDAEITIELDLEDAGRFLAGTLVLSNALIEGRARARGPIRKYLAVDPILRGLLSTPRSNDAR